MGDDGADWFDMEAPPGLSLDELDENCLENPSWSFEFPLPVLPVMPMFQMKKGIFDVQVFL